MGRAKIKKKSTFIDMTAKSDVTVLLLTFFMLTSTFVKSRFRKRISFRFWWTRKGKYL